MSKLTPLHTGRRWFVSITQTPDGCIAQLGTWHPRTGTQVWTSTSHVAVTEALTEAAILDELWYACSALMEARSHLV